MGINKQTQCYLGSLFIIYLFGLIMLCLDTFVCFSTYSFFLLVCYGFKLCFLWFSVCANVSVSTSVCVSSALVHSFTCFFLYICLFSLIQGCFILFYFVSSFSTCFLKGEGKKRYKFWWLGKICDKLEGETLIRIYCMKNKTIFKKRKKEMLNHRCDSVDTMLA